MEEEQTKKEERTHRPYKVMEGDLLFVKRRDGVGKSGVPYTFYYANLPEKEKDGSKTYYQKPLNFRNGVALTDGTKIRVLNMFEKVRSNPLDKYHPIWSLFITEFEIVDEPSYYEEQTDIENYQGLVDDNLEELNEVFY